MPKQRPFIAEHYFCSSSNTTVKIRFQISKCNSTIRLDDKKRIVDKFCTEYTLSDLPRAGQSLTLTMEQKWHLCSELRRNLVYWHSILVNRLATFAKLFVAPYKWRVCIRTVAASRFWKIYLQHMIQRPIWQWRRTAAHHIFYRWDMVSPIWLC